ncbi:hypothetical protein ALP38_00285 [Pseudomonas amygdali pv. sesami]|nr:hypothetical protein ALP38_00285 [Pseudomonas amygdali pv. sesami]
MSNPTRQTYVPSHLSAGAFPVVIETGIIAAGQKLKRGAVLGQVDASGEYVLCAAAADNGSQAPKAVLDQDVDTTGGAFPASILLTGRCWALSSCWAKACHLPKQKQPCGRCACSFVNAN